MTLQFKSGLNGSCACHSELDVVLRRAAPSADDRACSRTSQLPGQQLPEAFAEPSSIKVEQSSRSPCGAYSYRPRSLNEDPLNHECCPAAMGNSPLPTSLPDPSSSPLRRRASPRKPSPEPCIPGRSSCPADALGVAANVTDVEVGLSQPTLRRGDQD